MGGPKGVLSPLSNQKGCHKEDPHRGQVPSARGTESQCLPENKPLLGHPYYLTHTPVSGFDGLQGKGD